MHVRCAWGAAWWVRWVVALGDISTWRERLQGGCPECHTLKIPRSQETAAVLEACPMSRTEIPRRFILRACLISENVPAESGQVSKSLNRSRLHLLHNVLLTYPGTSIR